MLVKQLYGMGSSGDLLTLATPESDEEVGDEIPDTKCVTERHHLIIDNSTGSFMRLDRKETLELAMFLTECASVMED